MKCPYIKYYEEDNKIKTFCNYLYVREKIKCNNCIKHYRIYKYNF